MRLLTLDGESGFSLTKTFMSNDAIPPYAILSHTWQDGQEVTFDDLTRHTGGDKEGYKKLWFCANQCRRDNLEYFWVDTCCINKHDAVELQKAINSMFRWYQKAAKCYVYLPDVSINEDTSHDQCLR